MKETKILDAIDLVCLNCVEDTLNNENICDNCPVRKLADHIDEDMMEKIYENDSSDIHKQEKFK